MEEHLPLQFYEGETYRSLFYVTKKTTLTSDQDSLKVSINKFIKFKRFGVFRQSL